MTKIADRRRNSTVLCAQARLLIKLSLQIVLACLTHYEGIFCEICYSFTDPG